MIIKGDTNPGNYEILDKIILSEHQLKYELKKDNKIYHIRLEDYRNADFMTEKFYSASMAEMNTGNLKSIDTKNIEINENN
jgi:hypothetical protein